MNPYERVFNRIEGKKVDKIPNLNIIMTFAAKYINIPYKKYVTDYRYLVEGNLKCCENFGIDMVSAISDPCREGFDFGAEVELPEDDVPRFRENLIKEYKDLNKIRIIDPLNSVRMLDRIKAVELYKTKVKQYYPILGWVEGAFAEAADLRGLSNLMIDLIESPDFVHELLEICTQQAVIFAEEQIRAGADFIGIGDAAASLIGPEHYKNFVLPYEKKVCKAIKDAGGKVKLHICGDITSILPYLPLTNVDIIDIDWMVNFKKAVNTFRGKSSACGNFDPVSILLSGSTGEVIKAAKRCISVADETTFIAAGCEVPKDTPYENLLEMNKVLF